MTDTREKTLRCILDDTQLLNTNLVEFYVLEESDVSKMSENVQVYNTDLAKDKFYRVMQDLQLKFSKYYVQQYKCNVLGDIHYMNNDNKDITISSRRTTCVGRLSPHILYIGSNKRKLSILSFPSSQVFDSEEVVKAMTFKVSNRISISLLHHKSVEHSSSTNAVYEIKLSYSHDTNVDKDVVVKQLLKLLKDLEQASIS